MTKQKIKKTGPKISMPDAQLERMLAHKCLSDQEYSTLVFDHFDSRWFENKKLSFAVEIAVSYFKKYGSLPNRAAMDSIIDKAEEVKKIDKAADVKRELDALADVCKGMDDKFVKDCMVEFVQSKAGYFAILDNLEEIRENKNVSNCIATMQNIAEISFDINLGFNYFEDILKHEADVCNPAARLSLGFESLDKITHGGVYSNGRCLFVMMGQPGIGKSLFLSNFGMNFLSQNKMVLIFSLEMSEMIYGTRIDAHLSGEDINELQFKFNSVKDKINNFKKLYPGSELIIKEYPPNTINCNHLINFTNKLIKVKGRKPDVILVDYINLLNPATNRFGGSENSYTAVGTVAKELRTMSYIFECPVLSVTQVNREGYDTEEVSMSNTSESAGINQHCDFMGAIFQLNGDRDANKMKVKILKNRLGGQVGKTCDYFINYRNLTLKDYSSVVDDEGAKTSVDVDEVVDEISEI